MNGAMIKRALNTLAQRVRLTVSRGVVSLVNDSLKSQGLQVSLLSDEVQDDVERFQEYGFTSTPFTGAEALFLSVGANRSHGIVVCVSDRRHRPLNLAEGDVCLFTDKGERVYLDRINDIVNIGAKMAAAFIARADLTDARIDTLQTAHDTHIHLTTATVGPSAVPGVLSVTAAPVGALATVSATKGKVT